MFKSALEEREFEIKPAFLADLNDQLDEFNAPNKKRKGGYLWIALACLIVLSVLGVYMFNSSPNSSSEQELSSQNQTDSSESSSENSGASDVIDEDQSSSDSSRTDSSSSEGGLSGDGSTLNRTGDDLSDELIGLMNENILDPFSNGGNGDGEVTSYDDGSSTIDDNVAAMVPNGNGINDNASDTMTDGLGNTGRRIDRDEDIYIYDGLSDDGTSPSNNNINNEGDSNTSLHNSDDSNEDDTLDPNSTNGDIAIDDANNNSNDGDGSNEENEDPTNSEDANVTTPSNEDVTLNTDGGNSEDQDPSEPVDTNPSDSTASEGNTDQVELDDSSSDPSVEPPKPNQEPGDDKWSIQLAIGGSYVSRMIQGTPEYMQKRTDEEQNIFAPQFSLGVNYHLNNWRLSAGIDYLQLGEDVNYTPTITETDVFAYFDTTIVIDTLGIDTTYTPVYVVTTDTNTLITEANGKNRYSYITVPLTVGYRFDIGNFSIAPRLGIGLRFALGGTGRYASEDLSNYAELKPEAFSLSYHGSIEFAYRFKQIGVFIEPRFQSTFGTFNSNHRYWDIGGQIGLRYYFKTP
ncbi:MAG: hypothetical protein QNK23_15710 [Crocinitomicaceae bacterium]|nr:hypothetical protein [Crocinitomicaceae bacterium]